MAPFSKAGGHIGADIGDGEGIALMSLEVLGEGGHCGGILAGRDEQELCVG